VIGLVVYFNFLEAGLWLLGACPLLNEQFAVAQSEAYFNKHGVSAFEWEHTVLSQIFWQVDKVFAVFSSK
jgi:hypothetical protein